MNTANTIPEHSSLLWRAKYPIIVGVIILAVWLSTSLIFITFAQEDEPQPVDALYLLGGVTDARLTQGLALMDHGYSPVLVLTVSEEMPQTRFCAQEHAFEVHCVTPDPLETIGEAKLFNTLAQRNGWDSAMVFTLRSHLSRAESYFERCFQGDLTMIAEEETTDVWDELFYVIYENAAYVKYVFSQTCR